MELAWTRLDDPRVAPLLAGLSGEYQSRYGELDVMADAVAEQFDPPTGAFLVVVEAGATVAGGGLRRLDERTCELKRMWTSPQHRRRGLAATVLDALETRAGDLGYRAMRLETGPAQPEALSLYASRGYEPIEVYGQYEEAHAFQRELTVGP